MLQTAILNPALLDLLARIRHTNTLVIADWAFPYWPEIETVDLSLTRGIPRRWTRGCRAGGLARGTCWTC